MISEGARQEARRQEDHENPEMRGGRCPESTEVAYASFPKGTQQYPNPDPPAACSDCGDL